MGDKQEKILVTSALPYANGPIHFGHITGAYLPADIYVRYKKMNGADIVYICGTDDHGVAITISAEAAGRSPEEHVAINHDLIKSIFDKLDIDFTYFSQTSNETNHKLSQHFFRRLKENGLMEEKETEQYFCVKCDRFLADRYLSGTCPHCGHEGARGDECGGCGKYLDATELKEPACKVCGGKPETRTTKNWYLDLKKEEKWLEEWLDGKLKGDPAVFPEGDPIAWKKIVVQEIRGYLSRGLESRCITRDLDWGVRLPEEDHVDGKVLYVWFDAPIGYIAFTQEYFEQLGVPDKWKEYWQNPEETKLVHFIGKDNIVFHAMIFPIMMKGVDENYNLPHFVAGNAFLNLEGRQFSKSEGWYVDPLEFLENYPADSIRYYLCSEMPEHSDTEFRWENYQNRHNSELTNIYANLVNRTLKFISSKLDGKVPPWSDNLDKPASDKVLDDGSHEFEGVGNSIAFSHSSIGEFLNKFEFRLALYEVMNLARAGNKFFDDQAPWKSLSEDPEKCNHTLRTCLLLIKTLAVVSAPFLPQTAQRIWDMLGLEGKVRDVPWSDAPTDVFRDGASLPPPDPLFKKIDNKQIAAEKKKLGIGKDGGKKKKKGSSIPGIKKAVDINDFGRLDLRVGRVVEAEAVQGSVKMLKLVVDIGLEKRQVIAGIAKFYKPEELEGRLVVLVANLEPKKLMGLESQGMVLAAGPADNIVLLAPDRDIEPGTRIS